MHVQSKLSINRMALNSTQTLHFVTDEQKASKLIAKGADVNALDEHGKTPLHLVENPEVAKILLEAGANVHALDNTSATPLHKVANREIAKILIKAGANVNALDEHGTPPLHYTNDAHIAKFLIKSGAEHGPVGEFRITAMHRVTSPKVAKVLLKAGADLNAQDKEKKAPLHWLAPTVHSAAVEWCIKKGADCDLRDKYGRTPLFYADRKNAHSLLKAGASLRVKDKHQHTALHHFALHGKLDILKLVIEEFDGSAVLKSKNLKGWTPLLLALRTHFDEVAKYLASTPISSRLTEQQKEKGLTAKQNKMDSKREPQMSYAEVFTLFQQWAEDIGEASAALVLNNAADFFRSMEQRVESETFKWTHEEVSHALKQAGVGANLLQQWLLFGSKQGYVDIVVILIKAGADVKFRYSGGSTLLHITKSAEVAEILLQAGADPNAKDEESKTALHQLHCGRNADLSRVIIEAGGNVVAVDNTLKTPLHTAAKVDVLKLFINAGAFCDTQDSNGKTPLHICCYNVRVVRALLENGADLTIKDNFSDTPLHSAVDAGKLEVVKLMLEEYGGLSSLEVKGYKNDTLLQRAEKLEHGDLVTYLKVTSREATEATKKDEDSNALQNITMENCKASLKQFHNCLKLMENDDVVKHLKNLLTVHDNHLKLRHAVGDYLAEDGFAGEIEICQ